MREFLVTKFVCSKCGGNLHLSTKPPPSYGKYAEGEPTGATKIEQLVVIEPCQCVTRQLEDMRNAAKVLLGGNTG